MPETGMARASQRPRLSDGQLHQLHVYVTDRLKAALVLGEDPDRLKEMGHVIAELKAM